MTLIIRVDDNNNKKRIKSEYDKTLQLSYYSTLFN